MSRLYVLTVWMVVFHLHGFAQSLNIPAPMSTDNLPENPLATIHENPGLTAIFRSWGFIGDSLCSGEMEYSRQDDSSKPGYIDMYEYSWGQFICRACGAEEYNYSYGGQTAKGWIERPGPRTWEGARHTPRQAYIIALGCNDEHQNIEIGHIQTDVDTVDYVNNAPTYIGYMAGIIQRLQSIQPRAKIFVVTQPKVTGKERLTLYNRVLRDLPSWFHNVYLIDLEKYAPVYDDAFKSRYYHGNHLNPQGYLLTANMFMTYIDWIMRKYSQEFLEVQFIGTDWHLR